MITEDYVSFEVAKLLKEKGFQAKCTACYYSDSSHTFKLISGRINYCNPRFRKYKSIPPYNAPTLQMAMKWLREVHKINLYLVPFYGFNREYTDNCKWIYEIDFENKGISLNYPKFNSYEEACEAAIKYCLTNLI